MPVEATHDVVAAALLLVLVLALLLLELLLELLQPAATSVATAVAAMITLLFMGMPLQYSQDLFQCFQGSGLRDPAWPGRLVR
jgi:hypothetical protein